MSRGVQESIFAFSGKIPGVKQLLITIVGDSATMSDEILMRDVNILSISTAFLRSISFRRFLTFEISYYLMISKISH